MRFCTDNDSRHGIRSHHAIDAGLCTGNNARSDLETGVSIGPRIARRMGRNSWLEAQQVCSIFIGSGRFNCEADRDKSSSLTTTSKPRFCMTENSVVNFRFRRKSLSPRTDKATIHRRLSRKSNSFRSLGIIASAGRAFLFRDDPLRFSDFPSGGKCSDCSGFSRSDVEESFDLRFRLP